MSQKQIEFGVVFTLQLIFKVIIGVIFYQLTKWVLHHIDITTFVALWIAVEVGIKSHLKFEGL